MNFVLDLDLITVIKFSKRLIICPTERGEAKLLVPINKIVYLEAILASCESTLLQSKVLSQKASIDSRDKMAPGNACTVV